MEPFVRSVVPPDPASATIPLVSKTPKSIPWQPVFRSNQYQAILSISTGHLLLKATAPVNAALRKPRRKIHGRLSQSHLLMERGGRELTSEIHTLYSVRACDESSNGPAFQSTSQQLAVVCDHGHDV